MAKIIIVGSIAGSMVSFRGDLIKAWLKRGYQVTALTRPAKAGRLEKIRALGAKYHPIPLYRDGMNPVQDFKLLVSLRHIIRAEKPRYIFAYTVKPIIYAAFGARPFQSVQLFAMITGLGYAFSGGSFKQRLVQGLLKLMYRLALKRYELVIFQNRDDLELFKELKLIRPGQPVKVVNGSGVNLEHYFYSLPALTGDLTFLLIARLIKSKGIREFAEAARLIKAKYPNSRFVLVGRKHEGPDAIERGELEMWQQENLIEYAGGTNDVRPYLKACSVYVLPSYREGTPRSVLEAMATGRPVITTNAPGCRETVREGENGFLVPVQDSRALAGAMEKFIEDPDLLKRMGAASRRIAEEKYDVHQVNREIIEAMGLKKVR